MRLSIPLVLLTALLPLSAAIDLPVSIGSGRVSGVPGSTPEVRVFKGIPYAAPPVGDLRWKAPKPPAKWEGVRKVDKFSPHCMQQPLPASSLFPASSLYASWFPTQPMSEDCLYLNVWTAAKSPIDKRPVMVWIYGGGLTRGTAAISLYDGEELAKKGAVLVTFNYRLNVFGFFAHPELTKESDRNASGNYGFLDQIAALEWVHKNISQFGGDPKRVTIFGESAGSWSVNAMVASPLARGLFQRAIGESGGDFQVMRKLSEAEAAGTQFGQQMHAPTLAALRKISADELLRAGGNQGTPNVDGYVLPEDVYTIFLKGRQNDVPTLVGSNADEGKSLLMYPADGNANRFISAAKQQLGADADAFLRVYPCGSDEEAKESFYASGRDLGFGWQMRSWARMQSKTGRSKTYMYYFTRVTPGPESSRYGAYHGSEIVYVFNNQKMENRPWTDTDRKLSDVMSSYWVNFAATGNPNGNGLPKWPAFATARSETVMEFGDQVRPIPVAHKDASDFLDMWTGHLRTAGIARQFGPPISLDAAK